MRLTGRPRTVRTDVARAVIAQCLEYDRRWSLQEFKHIQILIRQLCIKSYEKFGNMRKIAVKWVPYALTEQQKWCRYETCRIHLERYQNEEENLLNNMITIDETWVTAYEPELKRHSVAWRHEGSLRRQKFRQSPSPVKLW